MAFKLGRDRNIKYSGSVGIVTTPLEYGALAEARNDGTIAIDPKFNQNSPKMKRIMKHEMKHMQDMKEGRADYGENWMMWEDKIYLRKNGYIDGPNGRWPEGHKNHPWEAEAIQAEKGKETTTDTFLNIKPDTSRGYKQNRTIN